MTTVRSCGICIFPPGPAGLSLGEVPRLDHASRPPGQLAPGHAERLLESAGPGTVEAHRRGCRGRSALEEPEEPSERDGWPVHQHPAGRRGREDPHRPNVSVRVLEIKVK